LFSERVLFEPTAAQGPPHSHHQPCHRLCTHTGKGLGRVTKRKNQPQCKKEHRFGLSKAVSVMRYSASAFGFAFDAILDVLSSAIVLWRYSNAAAVHSAHREYIACVILGVIFLLSSICIVVKAIHDLSTRLLPEVDDFLFSVSILSGILCSILAVLKFMLGKVLTSRALITDGFNSLVGGVMGFSILLSAEVFKHDLAVWYLDGSIGVLISLTIFAYGVKLLIDMVPRVRQTRHYEMFE
uniref:Uncharacterized protein n=1 Tax=Nomascus leucogenys TaxID=61853 RepID=A0A2I3H8P1_NOMLE